jgi:hypothetical protein
MARGSEFCARGATGEAAGEPVIDAVLQTGGGCPLDPQYYATLLTKSTPQASHQRV